MEAHPFGPDPEIATGATPEPTDAAQKRGFRSYQFWVILRVREFRDQYPVKHEFFKRLHERFRKDGVKFAVPARRVTVEKT